MAKVIGVRRPRRPLSASDLAGAAALLRGVLGLIEAGTIDAATPTARAIKRRMEGAVIAAEQAAGTSTHPQQDVHKGSVHDTVL